MSQGSYDFWLLDLDGTLVDVETSYIHDVMSDTGRELDVSFTAAESEILWYGLGETRQDVFAANDLDPMRFWEVFHDVDDPEARAAATHLYPDAAEFVPTLAEPVGLVTHCQEYLTEPVLGTLDIGDWFDTVVCCSEQTGWKPDPGPVELAMQQLDVAGTGHRGVLAGDDPHDIGAARNAGLTGLHVQRHDPSRFGQCVYGDRRVAALTELTQ